MYSRMAPPMRPMVANTISFLMKTLSPKNMATMVGISTRAWPRAIFQPDQRSWKPQAMVTANTGPGMSTPDREMTATEPRNRRAESRPSPQRYQSAVIPMYSSGDMSLSEAFSTSMMETLWMREFMISSMLTGGLL